MFFKKLADGFETSERASLLLMMWCSVNGIPRLATNCPLFDAYHKQLGASPPQNRHSLQSQYLPMLDELVVNDMKSRLAKVPAVNLSSDGWRSFNRQDFIDVGIYWIDDDPDAHARWRINVLHPDLIPLPSSATSEAIQTLVAQTVESFVRLLYSPTTVGQAHLFYIASPKLPDCHDDYGWRSQ